jgi:DHA1 family bicyclomycin/chloramphenicol resistance-like MFS transporter
LTEGAISGPRRRIGRIEVIALLAMSMALGALGIDLMLPAFDAMRADLGLAAGSTAIAGTVTAYFMGLALGTLVYGPLADRYGRRRALFVSYAIYGAGAAASALSPSLGVLLAMRFVWGIGAAGARVITLAIIRDAYDGEEMSRAMSQVFAVFVLVPVVAPSVGAGILAVSSWRWVFGFCVLYAVAVALWTLRLPETLHAEYRLEARLARLLEAGRAVLSNRVTVGYGLAMTALYSVFIGYLGSSEIIFNEVFGQGANFPFIFGGLAAVMGVAMLVNARVVRSLGTRRLAHRALLVYLAAALGFTVYTAAMGGRPPLGLFLLGLATMFASHALLIPNLNAIAMEPMARVAGTASSIMGAAQLGLGALLGALIDRAFDGTVLPLVLGFAGYGALAFALVLWAEAGRLRLKTG